MNVGNEFITMNIDKVSTKSHRKHYLKNLEESRIEFKNQKKNLSQDFGNWNKKNEIFKQISNIIYK